MSTCEFQYASESDIVKPDSPRGCPPFAQKRQPALKPKPAAPLQAGNCGDTGGGGPLPGDFPGQDLRDTRQARKPGARKTPPARRAPAPSAGASDRMNTNPTYDTRHCRAIRSPRRYPRSYRHLTVRHHHTSKGKGGGRDAGGGAGNDGHRHAQEGRHRTGRPAVQVAFAAGGRWWTFEVVGQGRRPCSRAGKAAAAGPFERAAARARKSETKLDPDSFFIAAPACTLTWVNWKSTRRPAYQPARRRCVPRALCLG